MLARLIEQEMVLYEYAFKKKDFSYTFDEEEWEALKELAKLLEPLNELTKLFGLESSSIGVKFPFAKMTEQKIRAMQFDNAEIASIRDHMASDFQTRFGDAKYDRFLILSNIRIIDLLLNIEFTCWHNFSTRDSKIFFLNHRKISSNFIIFNLIKIQI